MNSHIKHWPQWTEWLGHLHMLLKWSLRPGLLQNSVSSWPIYRGSCWQKVSGRLMWILVQIVKIMCKYMYVSSRTVHYIYLKKAGLLRLPKPLPGDSSLLQDSSFLLPQPTSKRLWQFSEFWNVLWRSIRLNFYRPRKRSTTDMSTDICERIHWRTAGKKIQTGLEKDGSWQSQDRDNQKSGCGGRTVRSASQKKQ